MPRQPSIAPYAHSAGLSPLPQVSATAWPLVLEYCEYHAVPGRSDKVGVRGRQQAAGEGQRCPGACGSLSRQPAWASGAILCCALCSPAGHRSGVRLTSGLRGGTPPSCATSPRRRTPWSCGRWWIWVRGEGCQFGGRLGASACGRMACACGAALSAAALQHRRPRRLHARHVPPPLPAAATARLLRRSLARHREAHRGAQPSRDPLHLRATRRPQRGGEAGARGGPAGGCVRLTAGSRRRRRCCHCLRCLLRGARVATCCGMRARRRPAPCSARVPACQPAPHALSATPLQALATPECAC